MIYLLKKRFRVVALLTCRNEALYLERCLQHLYKQGIDTCVIDNDSTDNSVGIANSFKRKGVFRIENQPYAGYFDLVEQLRIKEKLAKEIDADWFIHHDADEIREAPKQFKSLKNGIFMVNKMGYNAINFDEFVFTPTNFIENFEKKDYVKEMNYYYFFEPYPIRRINAWKNQNQVIDLINSGGHQVNFEGIKIYPENFILRHYIILSKDHAIRKYYSEKVFSKKEHEERGWHGARMTFTPEKLHFPKRELLKRIDKNKVWDKSEIWKKHTFMEGDF